MTSYAVTQISLGKAPGLDNGTGTWQDLRWVVVPGSVPPPGRLAFTGQEVDVTTMLFAIADNVVPNWFGVAIPEGITEFSNANIFFHPTPAQAGYLDSDYPAKTGKWPQLFYYMERLGYQLDGAARNQVVIMPFLTEAATDTGILPGNWQQIVTDILTAVRDAVTGTAGPPVAVSSVVVSSFSAGIIYSDSFRKLATGLKPLLPRSAATVGRLRGAADDDWPGALADQRIHVPSRGDDQRGRRRHRPTAHRYRYGRPR